MRSRRSVRSFATHRPVPDPVLHALLATASLAPSNSNTQPWQVHALAGEVLAALGAELRRSHAAGDVPASSHFPEVLPDRMAERQRAFGTKYYATLNIDRDDTHARDAQTMRNYDFFGAPAGLLLTLPRSLRPHSWLDCGLFLQSLMLAAQAHGLSTCPQVSFARFDATIGRHLQLAADEQVVCGVSLGYAADGQPVNQMDMPRRAVAEFVRFHGFTPAVHDR